MAVSVGLSKLDAICAKLQDRSSPAVCGAFGKSKFGDPTSDVIDYCNDDLNDNGCSDGEDEKMPANDYEAASKSPMSNAPLISGTNDSKRNRRKAVAPRNISKVQSCQDTDDSFDDNTDDVKVNDLDNNLHEFKLNNQGIDFIPIVSEKHESLVNGDTKYEDTHMTDTSDIPFDLSRRSTSVDGYSYERTNDPGHNDRYDLLTAGQRSKHSVQTTDGGLCNSFSGYPYFEMDCRASSGCEFKFDKDGVLDLSITTKKEESDTNITAETQRCNYTAYSPLSLTLPKYQNRAIHVSNQSNNLHPSFSYDYSSGSSSSTDDRSLSPDSCTSLSPVDNAQHNITTDACEEPDSQLKDYAKSTMNEFLHMYGLATDLPSIESATHTMPNFSSQSILQNVKNLPVITIPASQRLPAHGKIGFAARKSLAAKFAQSHPSSFLVDSSPYGSTSSFFSPHKDIKLSQVDVFPAATQRAHALASPDPAFPHPASAPSSPRDGGDDEDDDDDYPYPDCQSPDSKHSRSNPFVNGSRPTKISKQTNHDLDSSLSSPSKSDNFDYSKYIRKYNTSLECGSEPCNELAYKEHFHCLDCYFRVFLRKEEMIRHYKWHKKRDDSLQHGFMRYSPTDDCSAQFPMCIHNGRQTHYHCLQNACQKVYISTSDVQMHANYHRKDSAIIQEGFQRFRATEDCGMAHCAFYRQRTTHFHCRRSSCRFTFKNKADMEKHKTYHQKDEVLGRDGFKKYMKYEHCPYVSCRFSKLSNHIHCIRPGCDYVLHSTGQLYSHKRKHERRDFESAYRRFRDDQKCKQPVRPHASVPAIAPKSLPIATPSAGIATSSIATSKNLIPLVAMMTGVNTASSLMSNGPISLLPSPIATTPVSPAISSIIPALLQQVNPVFTMPNVYKEQDGNSVQKGKHVKVEPSDDSCENSPVVKTEISENGQDLRIKTENTDQPEVSILNKDEETNTTAKLKDYADQLSGDKLNDSLTLPIPAYMMASVPAISVPADVLPSPAIEKIVVKTESENETEYAPSSPHTPSSPWRPPLSPITPHKLILTLPMQNCAPDNSLKVVQEKKARDESWIKYLKRYTANDPCRPQCDYLYKDHYHCRIAACTQIFRSKDSVREHARYHELQQRITNMSFQTYENHNECIYKCKFSHKERHYHCLWAGCKQVICDSDPVFSRLDHFKFHDNARSSMGKNSKVHYATTTIGSTTVITPVQETESEESADSARRKRGRPPKYPRSVIPNVPTVNLTATEMAKIENTDTSARNGDSNHVEALNITKGFKLFSASEPCPDELCMFYMARHYHCIRPKCHHATDRDDVLNLHAKDFHNFVNILDGFEFFDRMVNCRRPQCHNNRTNRHFHCIRPKCDYSFVRHSTMTQHDKKHHSTSSSSEKAEQNSTMLSPAKILRKERISDSTSTKHHYVPIAPAFKHQLSSSVIKPAGTYFPALSMLPHNPTVAPPLLDPHTPISVTSLNNMSQHQAAAMAMALGTTSPCILPIMFNTTHFPALFSDVPRRSNTLTQSATGPLAILLQQKNNWTHDHANHPNWPDMRKQMVFYGDSSCSRPFCKLKKKDHYHCLECLHAFSDKVSFSRHLSKHGIVIRPSDLHPPVDDAAPDAAVNNIQDTTAENAFQELSSPGSSISSPKLEINEINSSDNNDDEDDDDDGGFGDSACLEQDVEQAGMAAGKELIPTDLSSSGTFIPDKSDSGLLMGSNMTESKLTRSQMTESYTLSNGRYPDSESTEDGDEMINFEKVSGGLNDSGVLTDLPTDLCISGRKRKLDEIEDSILKKALCAFPSNTTSNNPSKMNTVCNKRKYVSETLQNLPKDFLPSGYSRFRNSEDCGYHACSYRLTVTHFHCLRIDCGYGFSNKTRVMQHSIRHERVDNITAGEFRQFRGTVQCEEPGCTLSLKSSHFHCLQCNYVCLDAAQVLAHRKNHNKLSSIKSQGFERVAVSEECALPICPYRHKQQTHYHCIEVDCHCAVVSLSAMIPHHLKHIKAKSRLEVELNKFS